MITRDMCTNVPGIQRCREESGHESEVVVYRGGAGAGKFDRNLCVWEDSRWIGEEMLEIDRSVPF